MSTGGISTGAAVGSVNQADSIFRVGGWRVDPSLDEISKEGSTVKLERRAMQLLLYLARCPGQTVSVEQLLNEVWKGVVVTPDSVYQAVASLRRVLGDDSSDPTYIANVPRRGYRLVAAVAPGADSPSPPAGIPPASPVDASTAPATPEGSRSVSAQFHWVGWAVSVLLLMVLGYVIVDRTLLSHRTPTSAAKSAVAPTITDKSIAVLPFIDLSEKHDQEYFADGLAEEVLSLLSSLPDLKVISRTSSFQFKGKSADVRTVGRQLGAAYVVEGSVRRFGDRVRVTAQLISSQDGVHRWSDSYERDVGDVLRMQQEIAAALGRGLQVEVGGAQWEPAARLTDTGAYTAYLHGLHAMDKYDYSGLEEAIGYFERALALDPSLIRAREKLAHVYYLQLEMSLVTPDSGAERLRQNVDALLRDDPRSSVGHALRAELLITYDWDWVGAQQEADLAVSLSKNNSLAFYAAGDLAGVLGRWDQAETLFRQALAIDPLDGDTHDDFSWALYHAGRFADAEYEVRRVIEISPSYYLAHFDFGLYLLAQGQLQAALSEMLKETAEGPRQTGLAMIYQVMGRKAESDAALRLAERSSAAMFAYEIACAHAVRGENDVAFEWLRRAYLQKDYLLEYIKGEWALQGLRGDSRYKAFMHRMNLPE